MGSNKESLRRAGAFLKDDYRRRTIILSFPSIIGSIIYAYLTGMASAISQSVWLGIMTVFYSVMIFMKIVVLRRAGLSIISRKERFTPANNYKSLCINLIVFDVVFGISLMIFHINGIHKEYPGYTIYVSAIYVLIRAVLASWNMFKAKKTNSFTTISLRMIDAVKALIILLILITSVISKFGDPRSDLTRNLNSISGIATFLIILVMSISGLLTVKKERS